MGLSCRSRYMVLTAIPLRVGAIAGSCRNSRPFAEYPALYEAVWKHLVRGRPPIRMRIGFRQFGVQHAQNAPSGVLGALNGFVTPTIASTCANSKTLPPYFSPKPLPQMFTGSWQRVGHENQHLAK